MKLLYDHHTHTVHSHGIGTVEQNVAVAISRGLSEIAISDHSVRHAFYAVRDVDAYLKDIDRIREKYKDVIKVKSALELNLLSLDGELDIPRGYENSFDLLLFGFHKLVRFAGPSFRFGIGPAQIPYKKSRPKVYKRISFGNKKQ